MSLIQRKTKNGRYITVKTRRKKGPTKARQRSRRGRINKAQMREQTLMEVSLAEVHEFPLTEYVPLLRKEKDNG